MTMSDTESIYGVPEALDGGSLGKERMLYCHELVARFGHALALNWNLGEENTQTTTEQVQMMRYRASRSHDHPLCCTRIPSNKKRFIGHCWGSGHRLRACLFRTVRFQIRIAKPVSGSRESRASGRPLVVAFDESGSACTWSMSG